MDGWDEIGYLRVGVGIVHQYGAKNLCFGMLDDLLANNTFGPTMIKTITI